MARKLRIAMIGQKSIPARFGGIETHVEQLSTRLAGKGHGVWVYCRNRYQPTPREMTESPGFARDSGGLTYKDVRLAYRPSVNTKHFDAATHAFLCAAESALRWEFDIAHFHGIGPSAFAPVARFGGRAVVTTVHALDWRQVKWGKWAKRAILKGEDTGVRSSDGVIAVSRIIADYVEKRYGVAARYIPNGAGLARPRPPSAIRKWGLEGNDYILTVGRIIPDKGLHYLIEAFSRVRSPLRLVIVGSESPRTDYSRRLEQSADGRVIFTGDLYGDVLEEMYSNCRLYVLASEVEGLPITVCEAMAFGRCVLLSDIPENAEVGGDAACYFGAGDARSLREALAGLIERDAEIAARGEMGRSRVETHFSWDRLVDELESYYHETLEKRRDPSRSGKRKTLLLPRRLW
jgi:glycosyltransferase involved in cell wall biosynthesis